MNMIEKHHFEVPDELFQKAMDAENISLISLTVPKNQVTC